MFGIAETCTVPRAMSCPLRGSSGSRLRSGLGRRYKAKMLLSEGRERYADLEGRVEALGRHL